MEKIVRSEKEWREILTEEQFRVMRKKGTEKPFSCNWGEITKGIFVCAGCGLELFDSAKKFESGTGWPSYFEPIDRDRLIEVEDLSYGMKRTEVKCARCDSHLGHVFDDGPLPTGKRYCINSVCLRLVEV